MTQKHAISRRASINPLICTAAPHPPNPILHEISDAGWVPGGGIFCLHRGGCSLGSTQTVEFTITRGQQRLSVRSYLTKSPAQRPSAHRGAGLPGPFPVRPSRFNSVPGLTNVSKHTQVTYSGKMRGTILVRTIAVGVYRVKAVTDPRKLCLRSSAS
jgi:hypothetical protein